ncbi:Hypothetical protein CINCED_3A002797 [Cinara cedri]|uniref:Macro domain-containing protein n=1 Tax=Cinara cedri TaxID=506608 RepID=A0A5E4MTX2_9HEMI|nr:Hypothetical protein CINCED_3A002797 [Cinara cedri]
MELKSMTYCNNIIKEVDTFLFNMPVEYSLGHCVARDMRMSSGIAVYFKSIFGRVGELMDQRPNVGNVAYLQQNDRFIYYLITKNISTQKPNYNTITAAIKKLRDFVVVHGVKKLAIPRIGCGLDKLDWLLVKEIIGRMFKDVGCKIKVCHFTQSLTEEKLSLKINHPKVIRWFQSINDIDKREFEKLNFILFSHQTTSTAYWDHRFQVVNEKYRFKSQYFKDYEANLEVGQCLHYDTTEAHVYIIVINENSTDLFSYRNLEKGLNKITNMIENIQWHPTFIVQKMNTQMDQTISEDLINEKVISLISSTFLILTPCVIIEI